jgi:hypothetical protein
MLPAEATEPIERTDPAEPMLRIEPVEPMDRIDPLEPMLKIEPVEVIACYRMAVLGWSAADALTEAVNFGCSVPGQQAFIREFGELLLAGGPAAGRYPLLPPGSVKPPVALLAATLASVAAAEQNQIR